MMRLCRWSITLLVLYNGDAATRNVDFPLVDRQRVKIPPRNDGDQAVNRQVEDRRFNHSLLIVRAMRLIDRIIVFLVTP